MPLNFDIRDKGVTIIRTKLNDDMSETGLLFVPDVGRQSQLNLVQSYSKTHPDAKKNNNVKRVEVIKKVEVSTPEALFTGEQDYEYDGINRFTRIRFPRNFNYRIFQNTGQQIPAKICCNAINLNMQAVN